MDEIALLQAQLAAVQQQESALKLSDHNVIDLLTKLQQLGKIQFVHTLTGKQILTPQQIEREIEDHVALNGGRISLSELQQLLSIDRSYVERHVAQVARSNRNASGPNASQYFIVNNGEEVVTNWYLDAIMEDTNTLLQETGTMTIGELAQQFGFAVEYMKEVVTSRLGSILHAQERANVLYTDSFVESQRAQIRGVFTAITRPTFVPDIVRSYRFNEKVVDEYLPELIQKRVLMGTLRGREYVPYVFMDAQRESMYSFFQQNGYLDHARASQLQVTRPYDFLKKRFPDAIPLKDCVVSHELQLQLEGSIEVAVNDALFVDVRTILPSAIRPSDAGMLLTKSSHVSKGSGEAVQLGEVYAVSKAFLAASVEVFKKDAALKAQQASLAQERFVSSGPKDGVEEPDDDEDEDSGKRNRRNKKNAKAAAEEVGGSGRKAKRGKASQDENTSKTKAGKSKRGKKGAIDEGEEDSKTPLNKSSRGSRTNTSPKSITPNEEQIGELLSDTFPQIDGDDEFLEHVKDHLEGEIEKIYSSALAAALSSIHRGDAVSLRELRKKFEDHFDELYALMMIYEKGFNKLELHVDAKDSPAMEQLKNVEIHLLGTTGVQIATLVTSFVAASHGLELEEVPPFESLIEEAVSQTDEDSDTKRPARPVMHALSDENKKALEKNLSPATAAALIRLWTFATAGRQSLGDFTGHIPVVAASLSMPLRKTDRKKERQIIFSYRHSIVGTLEEVNDEDHAAITALIIQLFFQQITGLPASLPRDNLQVADMVLQAFSASIPEAAFDRLSRFVSMAKRLAIGEDDDASRWPTAVDEIRALVLAKDLTAALAGSSVDE